MTDSSAGERPLQTKRQNRLSTPRVKNREVGPARIQSLSRANEILTVIATNDGASLTDIARITQLNKSTAYYLVETLVYLGFVERQGERGGYRLGLRNLELGRIVQRRFDIPRIARPTLIQLCAETKETVNLAVPYLFEALIVESVEGLYGVRATSYAGTRSAYHSTACGKAIIAYLNEDVRHAIYKVRPLTPLTPHTVVDACVLEVQLERVRQEGIAFDFEENETSANCVAAPIFDGFGEIAGAISVSGPISRLTKKVARELAAKILAATRSLTGLLSVSAEPSCQTHSGAGRNNADSVRSRPRPKESKF